MKKLKEIVGLLEQIVPLVCGAQDGGPGSGIKGHTTNEESFHQKFIGKATKQENNSGTARNRKFASIPKVDGYEAVYKPYGFSGNKEHAGYYYQKVENK